MCSEQKKLKSLICIFVLITFGEIKLIKILYYNLFSKIMYERSCGVHVFFFSMNIAFEGLWPTKRDILQIPTVIKNFI